MSLVALANVICHDAFVNRFHARPADPGDRAAAAGARPARSDPVGAAPGRERGTVARSIPVFASRRFRSPHTTSPHMQFLSNGRYTTALTHTGGGFSTLARPGGDPAARRSRRWTPARTTSTCAIRGRAASGRRPISRSARNPTEFETTFDLDKVTYRCRDGDFETQLQVAVSPEDDVEVRRLSITNRGDRPREIEVTSYAEIVLARPEDDLAHPAFGKLFIETEFDPQSAGILFSRRPRGADEAPTWAFHVLGVEGRLGGAVEWETDRARFLGRGRSPANPVALEGRALSGTTGAVLDPIAALRDRVRLAPGAFVRVTFATGVAPNRDVALGARPQVPRRQRRGARVLDGVHPRAHHAAAPGSERRPGDALRSPGVARVRLRRVVHQPRRSRAQHARPVEPLGLRHLRRSADRPRAHHRSRLDPARPATAARAGILAASRGCAPTSSS